MTERELERAVVELARLRGWLVYHTHDSRYSAAGFPDLVFARRGSLIFVELKTATGTVSQAQQDWLDALELASVEVYVWRPADWQTGQIAEALI